jgi:DNA (cytosine-5)-methyltransferase 1
MTVDNRYEAVVVENVVDVLFWEDIKQWFRDIMNLGYRCQIVYGNSMHFPTANTLRVPQSRDRAYIVFSKSGNKAPDLELRPVGHCPTCDTFVRSMQVFKRPSKSWPFARWGRYKQQYVFRCPRVACRNAEVTPFVAPAADAIDWSLRGARIGDRDKQLAPATLARIRVGLMRYGVAQLVPAGGTWNDESTPVNQPMRTRTTRESEGLAVPPAGLIVPCEGREGKQARSTDEPLRTQTTRAETALVVPYRKGMTARPASVPMPTVTTVDPAGVAFVAELRGGGCKQKVRPVTEPLATVCANGNHHMLVRNDMGDRMSAATAHESVGRVLDFARFAIGTAGDADDRGDLPPALADSTFRMLEPDEIRRAMAFAEGYTLLGTRRERVKQLGNAVTPPAAEFLISRIAESLGYPPVEYPEYAFAA